jgi:hypothetical protein
MAAADNWTLPETLWLCAFRRDSIVMTGLRGRRGWQVGKLNTRKNPMI